MGPASICISGIRNAFSCCLSILGTSTGEVVSGAKPLGFDSRLYDLLTLQFWASCSIGPCFIFLVCKLGVILILPPKALLRYYLTLFVEFPAP